MPKYSYEYDQEREVLVRHDKNGLPMLMRKSDLVWESVLDSKNDMYGRAIFLGQGCWDRLNDISSEEAEKILAEWGIDLTEGKK